MNRRKFFESLALGAGGSLFASSGYALKFYPNPSKTKWAVIYGTRYGSNRDAAIWISEGMGAIADVFDARENPDLAAFDSLIIGSGIYYNRIAQPLESLIKNNVALISKKLRAVFVVSGGGESMGYASKYLDQLASLCQANPPMKKAFPGRMTRRLLSAEDLKGLEEFYKNSKRPFEDYDQVKRIDFLKFGEEILKQVT